MDYSKEEVMQYVKEDGAKFIRLVFCDVFGVQKNIAVQPSELERAFTYGIPINASAVAGFKAGYRSDLFLKPDPSTLCGLPWRPENGRVVRMLCSVLTPDGKVFAADSREILKKAVDKAAEAGLRFDIGPKMEFYVFKTDENGDPTDIPQDNAGYLDVAPKDKGENIRREICLTLEQMGIPPESSHHEVGPGQNEIDFRYSDPLSSADNALTFRSVVEIITGRNGLAANFDPQPLKDQPGSAFHINFSVNNRDSQEELDYVLAGILAKIKEMTLFLNPAESSYERLGKNGAPGYISWSHQNRSQLIRIPASPQGHFRAELRSPDCLANPYLAYALLISAGTYGYVNKLALMESSDMDLSEVPQDALQKYEKLPQNLKEAKRLAAESSFIKECLPEAVISAYLDR